MVWDLLKVCPNFKIRDFGGQGGAWESYIVVWRARCRRKERGGVQRAQRVEKAARELEVGEVAVEIACRAEGAADNGKCDCRVLTL